MTSLLGSKEAYWFDRPYWNIWMDWNCIRTTRTSLLPLKEQNKLETSVSTLNGLLNYVLSMVLEACKTLAGAFQIFLLFPYRVASCQGPFDKTRKLKSYLLYSMSQDRITNLALLWNENNIASFVYFSGAMWNFAGIKYTKVHFLFLGGDIYENWFVIKYKKF